MPSKNTIINFNRKAYHKYNLLKTYEVGLVLKGSEIKSIRKKHADIRDSFVVFKDHKPYVLNLFIKKYQFSSQRFDNVEEIRSRALLMHKNEILKLELKKAQLGATIIVLKLFLKNNRYAKLEIALAKSVNKQDKRQKLLEKEIKKTKNQLDLKFN